MTPFADPTDITHNLLCDALASVREVLFLPPTISDSEIARVYGPLLAGWLMAAATAHAAEG